MTDVATPTIGPAEAAFEAMTIKLAGLTAAIDGFAARQQELHARDYSEDLAKVHEACVLTHSALRDLHKHPAMALTPEKVADQLRAGGAAMREADHRALQAAEYEHRAAASSIRTLVASAMTAQRQKRIIAGAAAAALLLGFMLGDRLPRRIALAMPESWEWPEDRAAQDLGRDRWDAGLRLLQVSDPEEWHALRDAAILARENAKVLAGCGKRAAKSRKAVTCAIEVSPPATE